MSYLDKLLAGRPVSWKPLGEVCETVTDFTAAGSFASNAKNVKYLKVPDYALMVRTTDLKQCFSNSESFVFVDEHAFSYLWRVNLDTESIILPNVGNCGEVYFTTPKDLPHTHCVLGPNALLLRSRKATNKYLYYWFQCLDFQRSLLKITSNTGQSKFNKTNLKKISIPIPPKDVQEEIVRVLDRFTELEARQKQYAYYRDLLLTFPDDAVTYLPLGDIADIKRGKRVVRKDLAEEGSYAVFQNSLTPLGYFDKWNVPKDSCFVVAAGAAGEIGYSRENFWAADDIYYFESSGNLIDRYLYHFLLSSKHMITSKVRTASIPRLSRIALERLPIPIPPLEEQERIVGILDRFETLAHSITEGLPRELELRRKQYGYYRDLLLDFPHQD